MSDIATIWTPDGGDWQLSGASFLAEEGLYTAVVLSLFTDRRAEDSDELPSGVSARRGWWGDAYADVPGDKIGSRLWLLQREKVRPAVLRRAEGYAREALQWLIDDGIARAVEVLAEETRPEVLGLQVSLVRSAQPVVRYRFERFWKGD